MNAWNTGVVPASDPDTGHHDAIAPEAPVTTVVHLLRHGKVHNPDDILYGRLAGYRLSVAGHAMAGGIAEHFATAADEIAYLAASRLERAQQTVAPLAELTGLPVITDDRLIEAANRFEGTRFTAGRLRDPRVWGTVRNPLRPSWGEPYLDIARRMLGAMYAAERAARGRVAVLVSHQLPIWILRRFLTGQRLWHHPSRRQCALASLTTVRLVDGVVTAVGYSEPVAAIVAGTDGSAGA